MLIYDRPAVLFLQLFKILAGFRAGYPHHEYAVERRVKVKLPCP